MRIIGFSKKWDKLNKPIFTTFRLPRKDKDWYEGEIVQVVYKPRSKERETLGQAVITHKETKELNEVTSKEAVRDGFPGGRVEIWRWMLKAHKLPNLSVTINKLVLQWQFHYAKERE